MVSMSGKVYFDANVLLEIISQRTNVALARREIRAAAGRRCISTLTGHLAIYFGGKSLKLATLQGFLSDFEMLSLTAEDFEWVHSNIRNNNFEDALQLAVAIRNGCDTFITFDKELYQTYKSLPQLKIHLLQSK